MLDYIRKKISFKNTSPSTEEDGACIYKRNREIINVIYMHVHKCAGTSMYRNLAAYPQFLCCVARSGSFPLRVGYNLIEPEVWNRSFKFTIVRNPWSRLVSVYKMFECSGFSGRVFGSFSEFIEYIRWSDVDGHTIDNHVTCAEMNFTLNNVLHHCSSYHNSKYHLEDMDYVIKLENLSQEINKVVDILGVNGLEFAKHRSNKPYDYTSYYDLLLRKTVAEKYAADIERFGYVFE